MQKLLKNWYLWFVVGSMAIIASAGIIYRVYSHHKFNQVVSSLQNQELRNTKDYVKVANLNYEITTADSSSDEQLATLQKDVDGIKQIVADGCSRQASGITDKNLDNKVKHLWLSSDQKKYIIDAKKVLHELESSANSSEGMCKAGKLLVGVDKNFIQMLPGNVTMAQLLNNPSAPSAQQVSSLKKYTTMKVADEAVLKQDEPAAASFVSYIYDVYANTYYELKAAEAGDASGAAKYATKVTQLSSTYDAKFNPYKDAAKAYDTKLYGAAIAAAKAEISLIDAQKHNSGLATKLDYSVPLFWVLDGKIGLYSSASKNNTNPPASNIQQLVSALHDNDLTTLYNRNLLHKASYTSLGNDNSGAELSVTLADGSKLTEKQLPKQ